MPTYELALVVKALQRPELAQAIKRSCTYVLEKGGLIRGMENLGLKPLPNSIINHGHKNYEGNYILIHFDSNPELPSQLNDVFKRDTDIIRKSIFSTEAFVPPCLQGPCEFGELKNPDHEKRFWWSRVNRRFVRGERRKTQRKA